ncbi:MAG: hypothetical protein L0Y72_23005 [Gemmataceae bacterium]|nr:hypothetical protein [Gemmataceae bacterium]MCI0741913.1 hypothetical protein [Gemmataceae bacterium]
MVRRILQFAAMAAVLFAGSTSAQERRLQPKNQARPALNTVTYPVADLVVPIESRVNLDVPVMPGPRAGDPQPVPFPRKLARATEEGKLMQLLSNSVAPMTWSEAGGPGTIQYFPLGMALVISQTPDVHAEIQAMLAALRRLQDVEVSLEIRVVSTTPQAFERACKVLKLKHQNEKDNEPAKDKWTVAPKGTRWMSFLEAGQQPVLLEMLVNDQTTSVMQAPKLTLFSGQATDLMLKDAKHYVTGVEMHFDGDELLFSPKQMQFDVGLHLACKTTASADRRFVELNLNGYWCQLAGPVALHPIQIRRAKLQDDAGKGAKELTPFQLMMQQPKFAQVHLNQELTVPDGGTVLVNAGVVPLEIPKTGWTSWLSEWLHGEVPTTSAERQVFLLFTTRIHVREEAEATADRPLP